MARPKPRFKKMAETDDQDESADVSLATGVTHLLLCGTSGWAIKYIDADEKPWAWSTFAFLLGHGMLGVLRYTHPHTTNTLMKLYDQCFLLANCACLPLINTQYFFDNEQGTAVALCHAGSGVIPVLVNLISESKTEPLLDVIILGNAASLAYITLVMENAWGMGLAGLCVFNAFGIDFISKSFEAPRVDLKTIGLCFFTIFAVNMLTEEGAPALTN